MVIRQEGRRKKGREEEKRETLSLTKEQKKEGQPGKYKVV
jgi:hypothetical protein